jgi:hypothetical protein
MRNSTLRSLSAAMLVCSLLLSVICLLSSVAQVAASSGQSLGGRDEVMPAPFLVWSSLPQRFDPTLDQDLAAYAAATPSEIYSSVVSSSSDSELDSFMMASDASLFASKRVEESLRAALGLSPLRFDGATPLFQAASPELASNQLVVLFLASRVCSPVHP